MTHPASAAQIIAANPETSTWLSANAGSGKTRVLTNRVAWLLLNGTPPERVLCLTYTKAAAGEMQNRLFAQLGKWAMMDDGGLLAELAKMGVPSPDADALDHARTLFARAIETPGGLKIQTIHAFCASLLRRFPLEARVSPQFSEMDDRAGTLLAAEVLEALVDTPDGMALFDEVAQWLSDADAEKLCADIIRHRERLTPPKTRKEIFDAFGLDEADDIMAQTLTADVLSGLGNIRAAAAQVKATTMVKLADKLAQLDLQSASENVFHAFQDTFLTQKGEPRKSPVTADVLKLIDPDMIDDLKEVALAAHHQFQRQQTAAQTAALHGFAGPYLAAIERRKADRGWLDFEDLIQKTRNLLSRSDVAQWVLFKLDGGIDHILVDEAQDTSPTQWEVITSLAAEFASGEGARSDTERTIFVVGDRKQSIYSFQGAQPERFDEMRDLFSARLAAVDAPFQSRELVYSFRSSPTILELVDATCGMGRAPGTGADVAHTAFFTDKPGRVDLWPVIPPTEKDAEERDWFDPVDRQGRNHHHVLMAERVAHQIEKMLDSGTVIEVEGEVRPIRPGDIIVLLQRRKELFHNIIRACKARGLPLAGADVLKISGELAVRDLTALLQFLATPEDDLSLAAVLRSPLFGWSEDDLFRLAHGRHKTFLWTALRDAKTQHPATFDALQDLLNQADFLRPYELLDRVLVRMKGRQKLTARLGTDCTEALDALLQQALNFERSEVPSLTGFLGWLDAEEITIKRQMDSSTNLIRVMSVHGAKGLESPVVILPECEKRKPPPGDRLITGPDNVTVWAPSSAHCPPELSAVKDAAQAAAMAERDRLLYVAMTRAESWLIVGAAGDLGKEPSDSWYGMIEQGMQDLDADPLGVDGEMGLRLQSGPWTTETASGVALSTTTLTLRDLFSQDAPTPIEPPKSLSPSELEGAKALPGEGDALPEDLAMLRGTLVHRLLEHLPDVPRAERSTAAVHLLGDEADQLDRDQIIAEALTVLNAHPKVFATGTLSEATVTAPPLLGETRPLLGIIDRLILTGDKITVIDFKSNAIVPGAATQVPMGLRRQMAAYVHALTPLYPNHKIVAAILWTRSATLMELPHDLVMASLQTTVDG